jgi:hypothetical protein
MREPTPDYDSSSPPLNTRLSRRNSDSGILPSPDKQAAVKRHASTAEPGRHEAKHVTKYGATSNTTNDDIQSAAERLGPKTADLFRESPVVPRSRALHPSLSPGAPQPPSKSLHQLSKAARNGYAVPHRDPFHNKNFNGLESTRIDFDESMTPAAGQNNTNNNTTTAHNQTIESDNNSDIVIDEKKMVSAGSDFKLVFISSESKSGSELNSSLECGEGGEEGPPPPPPPPTAKTTAAGMDDLRHVTGDYIDEMDWVNYQKKVHHQAAARRLSDSPRVEAKQRSPRLLPDPDRRNSPKTFMLDDFHYVGNLNGEDKQRHPSSSPSIKTILTSATKDSNSIPPSPRMPKIHNIHIRREFDHPHLQPPRPRSAMSTTTICSETSQDIEVQNILGNHKSSSRFNPNESQEIIIDFDSNHSNSFDLNTSFEHHAGALKKLPKFKPKRHPRTESNRSSADRSMDEMSLYDQMCLRNRQIIHIFFFFLPTIR